MTVIKVVTAPLARPFPCRAFYDTGGDTLSAGIKQRGDFKQTIEIGACSFDLTRDGKLLNIDIWEPRKHWKVEGALHPPEDVERANVMLSADGGPVTPNPEFVTDPDHTLLNLKFCRERIARFIMPATSLLCEVNDDGLLIGLWLLGIIDDINFKKEGEWRRAIKAV